MKKRPQEVVPQAGLHLNQQAVSPQLTLVSSRETHSKPRHIQGGCLSSPLAHPEEVILLLWTRISLRRFGQRGGRAEGSSMVRARISWFQCFRGGIIPGEQRGEAWKLPLAQNHVGFLDRLEIGCPTSEPGASTQPRARAPVASSHQNSPSSARLSSSSFCLGSM